MSVMGGKSTEIGVCFDDTAPPVSFEAGNFLVQG
jgi:hypothetical protein